MDWQGVSQCDSVLSRGETARRKFIGGTEITQRLGSGSLWYRLADYTCCVAGHHFFAMLVSANKLCADIEVMLRRFQPDNNAFAVDRVAGKYRAMKFKVQLAGDEVYVPTNLGG